ncbi:MAG TPA: hypothetical protein DCL54_14795 [Alphaproteobacteria bacterium]|nr:hypothetical protein [Alphaproteobacteria bacterium]HAJ47839.1 hypothetical protein [Alphaproteobacteria bacterium]
MFALDAATQLQRTAEGEYLVRGELAYWNFNSAFGGWAMAVAQAAVREAGGPDGALISLTAVFPDALKAKDLLVRAAPLREKAKTVFWRVSFTHASEHDGPTVFSADLIVTQRRKTQSTFAAPMPVAPPFADCPIFDASLGPKWMQHYEQRGIEGQPLTVQEHPRNRVWFVERDGRPWDEKGLVAISDAFMPRIFFIDATPRFGATVSFGLHLFAQADDYASAGNAPLLLEGDADAIGDGLYDQRGKLWSGDGRLLAVSNQVALYR